MCNNKARKHDEVTFFNTAQYVIVFITLALSTPAISRGLAQAEQRSLKLVLERTTHIPRVAVPSIALPRVIDAGIKLGDIQCAELNQLTMAEGHNPIHCRDSGSLNSNWTPTESATTTPLPLPQGDLLEPVLLIHGYSKTADHNCDVYWAEQKRLIEHERNEIGEPLREAEIVGWYEGNTNCDVYLPGELNDVTGQASNTFNPSSFDINTPIIDVARALRDWIFFKYTINGRSVDIVAHSLGGIVVRKMLDEWGDELLVSDVVTLGTPHAGVNSAVAIVCPSEEQCDRVVEGNEFINDLGHNPQGASGTQWTLVAADNDQIVGQGTGTDMNDGNGPSIIKIEYKHHHRHGCSHIVGLFSSIGHDDLIGNMASLPVYECNWLGNAVDEMTSPSDLILDAIY